MSRLIDELKGHENLQETWHHLVEENRLAPSYLWVGVPGVGKKLFAKALLQSLFCENPAMSLPVMQRACGGCGSCKRVSTEQHESLLVLESKNKVIKIEEAKKATEFLSLRSLKGRRFVLIPEADELNAHAANALLKIIEEPPEGGHFILMSPSKSAILPTLQSRCQVQRFAPLKEEHLRELRPEAPSWAIKSAGGRCDRLTELCEESKTRQLAFKALQQLSQGQAPLAFETLKEAQKDRILAQRIAVLWQQALRDAFAQKLGIEEKLHDDQQEMIFQLAQKPWLELKYWQNRVNSLLSDVDRPWDLSLSLQVFTKDLVAGKTAYF